jgi:hypothetical protein
VLAAHTAAGEELRPCVVEALTSVGATADDVTVLVALAVVLPAAQALASVRAWVPTPPGR